MYRITAVVVAGALVMSSSASAQSEGDFAAYFAISVTPVGALPLMARSTMFDESPAPASFTARYGSQEDLHNFGIGGDFRAGRSGRASLTLGVVTCDGCEGTFMVGADFIAPLVRSAVGTGATSPSLTVAINPSVGFSSPMEGDGAAVAAGVGLPIAVAMGEAGGQVAAFLSPGIAFGQVSGSGESVSGTRPMLGGGIGLRLGKATISGSAQKIFIEEGSVQYGLGIAVSR